MEKDELLQTLKHISDSYFQKKDYISAGMINRAMDVVNDYDGVLPQAAGRLFTTMLIKSDKQKKKTKKAKKGKY